MSRYKKINISGSNKSLQPDQVYIPYLVAEIIESDEECEKYMKQYHKQHEVCPRCGFIEYETTLMGYILDMNDKENYKDLNNCKCLECGYIHVTYERISKEKYLNIE